ncbi:unnamed protein product [Amoebophrya sp. A120]|nr:unnamed protein product [Amoebophrya sp. A120]|eukprot:GSA120T00002624001.1
MSGYNGVRGIVPDGANNGANQPPLRGSRYDNIGRARVQDGAGNNDGDGMSRSERRARLSRRRQNGEMGSGDTGGVVSDPNMDNSQNNKAPNMNQNPNMMMGTIPEQGQAVNLPGQVPSPEQVMAKAMPQQYNVPYQQMQNPAQQPVAQQPAPPQPPAPQPQPVVAPPPPPREPTPYLRGENLSRTPGFMSKILMDEIRVHTNRSVVTVSRAAAEDSETISFTGMFRDKYNTVLSTVNYVVTLSWANRGFCIPALFFYFIIAGRCALAVHIDSEGGDESWRDVLRTCKEWGERGSDYVPSMLTSILPIFLVVFYVNAAIKRYYKMYDACREMSDITDQAVGIALIDFRKHPECIKEEVRCLHLARMLVLLHTARETYPVKTFFLPLCECFGDKMHGMLTEKETNMIRREGYSEHLAQYFVVKALNVTHAATHKGLISPPGCAARTMHLMKMMDSSQKIKSLTSMQYPPTYTYLVSSTVGISCILEIAFAGTRVGLQWNTMMFWESFLITFSLLVAQQVCLFGILGVAGEMIDPFGRDIRDFPILQMCVAPLQHTVQLLFEYKDLRDDAEANMYQDELGVTESWGPQGDQDLTNRHTRHVQRFKESSMLSSEELAKVDPKQLGESYSAEAERILNTLKIMASEGETD